MILPVAAHFDSPEAKDNFEAMVQACARKMEANFCVMISEAWTLAQEDVEEFMANRHLYPNGICDHPGKKEIVNFMVESHKGKWSGRAEILRGADSCRMTEVNFQLLDKAEGRFTHFLPKAH
jgi:hypothetical protein